eukprot:6492762-Amphidinium_carterae.1
MGGDSVKYDTRAFDDIRFWSIHAFIRCCYVLCDYIVRTVRWLCGIERQSEVLSKHMNDDQVVQRCCAHSLPKGWLRMLSLSKKMRYSHSPRVARHYNRRIHAHQQRYPYMDMLADCSTYPTAINSRGSEFEGVRLVLLPFSSGLRHLMLIPSDLPEDITIESLPAVTLERMLFDLYPMLLCDIDRLSFCNGQGVCRHQQPLPGNVSAQKIIHAIPSIDLGANGTLPPDYDNVLARLQRVSKGWIKPASIKLLLRGDPQFYQKVADLTDYNQLWQIMRSTAQRYNIQIQTPFHAMVDQNVNRGSSTQRHDYGNNDDNNNYNRNHNGHNNDDDNNRPVNRWQTASRKKRNQNRSDDDGTPPRLQLLQDDWTAPILSTVAFGKTGVVLAPTQDDAESWGRRMCDAPQPVVILSLQPVLSAFRSDPATFRALQPVPVGGSIERIFNGYINHFGPQDEQSMIQHLFTIVETRVSTSATTTVLSCSVRSDVLSQDDWRLIRTFRDARSTMAYLRKMKLDCEDVFRLETTTTSWKCMLRIKTENLRSYLITDLPFTTSPVGDHAKPFRVLWDKEATTISDIRTRFSALSGYAGPVVSTTSLGFRVHEKYHNEALRALGRHEGELYYITGLPHTITTDQLQALLDDLNWDAHIMEGSRRAQRGTTTFRLRAKTPPPATYLRAAIEDLVAQIRIALHQPKSRKIADEPKLLVQPTTWQQSARQALGVVHSHSHPTADEIETWKANGWQEWGLAPDHDNDVFMRDAGDDYDWEPPPLDEWGLEHEVVDDSPGAEQVLPSTPVLPHPLPVRRPWQRECPPAPSPTPADDQNLHADATMQPPLDQVRLDALEQSVKVGRQVTPPIGITQVDAVSPPHPAVKRSAEEARLPASTSRAVLDLPLGFDAECTWREVPKDGSCIWHALAVHAHDRWHEEVNEQCGLDFKADQLSQILASRDSCADLLGGKREAIDSIVEEFRPPAVWADVRALLLVAYQFAANILIVNAQDSTLEFFSPFNDLSPAVPLWLFHYNGSHYEPGFLKDCSALRTYLENVALAPWTPTKILSGGASRDSCFSLRSSTVRPGDENQCTDVLGIDAAIVSAHSSASNPAGKRTKFETSLPRFGYPPPQHDYSNRRIAYIGSLNINGYKTNGSHALAVMRALGRGVLCLQETHMSKDVQKSTAAVLSSLHIGCIWGAPTPHKLSCDGRTHLDTGAVPGVAILFHASLNVLPIVPLTEQGLALYDSGRLQIALLRRSTLDDFTLVFNVYAPSGENMKFVRKAVFRSLLHEIAAHDTRNAIVIGDLNELPGDSLLFGELVNFGWHCPWLFTENGNKCDWTYHSGDTYSWLDTIMVGPNCCTDGTCHLARRVANLQHSLLYMPLDIATFTAHPKVRHPNHVSRGVNFHHHSPIDWDDLALRLWTMLQTASLQRHQLDPYTLGVIDQCWKELLSAYKIHVLACHTVDGLHDCDDAMDHLGKMYLNWCPPPSSTISTRGVQTHEESKLAGYVQRLIALARGEASESVAGKLRQVAPDIASAFRIKESDVLAHISNSEEHTATWIHYLSLFRKRRIAKSISEWKRTLVHNLKPTRALFRWIKGRPAQTHFILRHARRLWCGPKEFFECLRTYWSDIMCATPNGRTDLRHWLQNQSVPQPTWPSDTDVEYFMSACASMKTGTASGLDNWPPEAVKLIPREAAVAFLVMFSYMSWTGSWATSLRFVRTQFIPKTSDPSLAPSNYRPISITSCWYRVWARFALISMEPSIMRDLHEGLRGGIPHRNPTAQMLTHMLRLEQCAHAAANGFEAEYHMLTLDATKCFDRIQQVEALELALKHQMMPSTVSGLGGFLLVHHRRFSSGGLLDQHSIFPTNGFLQGDALSAVSCNFECHEWAYDVQTSNENPDEHVIPQAFLDDRTITTDCFEWLVNAWQRSLDWDTKHKWLVNASKTCHMHFTSHKNFDYSMYLGDTMITHVDHLRLIGYELYARYNLPQIVQHGRLETAIATCRRLELLDLPIPVVQQMIQRVVALQFCYNMHVKPVTTKSCKRMKSAIIGATGMRGRAHDWGILSTLMVKSHLYDPFSVSMYTHLTSVLRGIRDCHQSLELWKRVRAMNLRIVPRGPVKTTLMYLHRLHIVESCDYLVWEGVNGRVHILDTPYPELQHFIRGQIRHRLWLLSATNRHRLQGAPRILRDVTMPFLHQKGQPLRKAAVAIACDALWTRRKLFMCGFVPDQLCPFCSVAPETVEHVFYECSNWELHRIEFRALGLWGELLLMPPCARLCALCTNDASPNLRLAWPKFQTMLATIWSARMQLYHDMGFSCIPDDVEGFPVRDDGDNRRDMCQGHPRRVHVPTLEAVATCRQNSHKPWPYPRTAWHELCAFFARTTITDDEAVPRISLLELLLSFQAFHSGKRFLCQTSEETRGGWISHQLGRFRQALLSFQVLTDTAIIPTRRSEGEMSEWLPCVGFPKMQLCVARFIPPCWSFALEKVAMMRIEVTP